ncbi:hypothetical protein EUTSA_v10026887mg [Eutrema salsugineum]|uniref:Uncharacterized protein n=1 Tax=Eutrema salsugineum TaxID=72664 RepID=V4MKM2_EUTSA|nr:hypothetical protein EUTSA_v10026887mg [Eutrema salsugineum]
MEELEIVFEKSNTPREEVETSAGRGQKKFWEETKPFSDVYFSADNVWLFNFSGSKEEFILASRFRWIVMETMIIKPLSVSQSNKLEIEGAVAILKELPGGHSELDIIMA